MGFLSDIGDRAAVAKSGHIAARAVPIIQSITGGAIDAEGHEYLMEWSTAMGMGRRDKNKYDYAFDYLDMFYLNYRGYGAPPKIASSEEFKKHIVELAMLHIEAGDISSPILIRRYTKASNS